MSTAFDLTVWPDANLVSVVRRFIEEVYEKRIADLDAVARIALTTHELLENAVKFAANGSTRLLIETESVDPGSDRVVISVFNHSDLANIHKLNGAFAEMAGEADAFVYYQRLMRRTMKQPEGSGLGLARIRAEGEMALSLQVEGDRVCLRAQADVQRGHAA